MDKTKDNNIINFPDNKTDNTQISQLHHTKRKQKYRKSNSYRFVFILIALIFIIGIFMLIDDSSFNATNSVNTEPISILSTENYCFSKYKKGYIFAKDGKISCYNTNQQLQWEINSSKTAPTVITNDNYVLTYYTKDKLAIITNGTKTRKITTDGNVIYGNINKNGYAALIVEEDGFKSQLAVYDNNGKLKFKWHNSEHYITSAMLSDNNKTLIASEVNLSDNGISSKVLITDIKKELSFEELNFNDSVICSMQFASKNKFIAVLDNKTVCYSTGLNKKWEIDYSGNNLYTYDISDTNYISLVCGKDDSALSNSVVYVYNGNGKKIGEYNSEKRIYKIDMQDRTSLISYDRQFEIINGNGKRISSTDLNIDIHDSIFIGTKKCALILSGSGASLVRPE